MGMGWGWGIYVLTDFFHSLNLNTFETHGKVEEEQKLQMLYLSYLGIVYISLIGDKITFIAMFLDKVFYCT